MSKPANLLVYLSIFLSVCMNALILVIKRARDTIYGIKLLEYPTQLMLVSNLVCHAHPRRQRVCECRSTREFSLLIFYLFFFGYLKVKCNCWPHPYLPPSRASLNSLEMGLVHAQHGVVLPHCAAFCGMLRRSQGKQTENCGAVCRCCSVFWQQRREGGGARGTPVASLSCVDC